MNKPYFTSYRGIIKFAYQPLEFPRIRIRSLIFGSCFRFSTSGLFQVRFPAQPFLERRLEIIEHNLGLDVLLIKVRKSIEIVLQSSEVVDLVQLDEEPEVGLKLRGQNGDLGAESAKRSSRLQQGR